MEAVEAAVEEAKKKRRPFILSTDHSRVRETLQHTGGNISRAAVALQVTKPYMMNLIKKLQLNAWCRMLRQSSGLPITGRPRKPIVVSDLADSGPIVVE